MTSAHLTQVQSIEDSTAFEGLREEWTALLAESPTDGLFLTWEWLFTWWTHLGAGRRLAILTVRSDGELIALAPLASRTRGLGRLLSVRSLEFLGTGSVGSDYLDLIVRRGREEVATEALAEHLARAGRVLRLGQLRTGSCVAPAVARRLSRRGWTSSVTSSDVCPFIGLSAHTWQSYLAGLDPNHRRDVQYALRRLGKQFDVCFEQARSEAERREFLSLLVALHHERWRSRGGSTAFHTPGLVAFHNELSRRALERGWLRLFVLRLDGRPAAALYCFRYGSAFYFYQGGFDPAYAKYSVGAAMVALTIKHAIEEGAAEYDLLHGREPYKVEWAREARGLERVELYPPRLRASFDRHAVELGRAARRLARRVLPRGVAERLASAASAALSDRGL